MQEQKTIKRIFDIVCSAFALVLLSPLLLCIAVIIRLSDKGPAIYRAKRAGLNGKTFVMHKFRTMRAGASGGSPLSAFDDPRIFPFGAFLRRTKMDELPQLFDVLRGEMSIIGPRPEAPEIVQKYYPKRFLPVLSAPPGLSSPASLHFYINCEKLLAHGDAEKTYAEKLLPAKLSMELDYVRNQSLVYDLRIIGRTVVAILCVNLGLRNFL